MADNLQPVCPAAFGGDGVFKRANDYFENLLLIVLLAHLRFSLLVLFFSSDEDPSSIQRICCSDLDSILWLILALDVIQYPFQQISRFRFAGVFAWFLARLFVWFLAGLFAWLFALAQSLDQLVAEALHHPILRASFQDHRVQSESRLLNRPAHFYRHDHGVLFDKKCTELRRYLSDAL